MDSEFKRILSPSLSLLIVASLTPGEHDVHIDDENVRPLDFDPAADLVGITVNVNTSPRAYQIADRYRSLGVPVVIGGIHASACPDEASQHADAVCIGEAEMLWPAILSDAIQGRLQPTYQCPTASPLHLTPQPRWDLLDRSAYLYTSIMTASRGCCFQCDFCYNSCDYVHQQYRNRPVDSVLREIDALPTRQVMFIDDNFIGDPAWVRDFLERIRGKDLIWHAAVSTNIGRHPDILDGMAATGCRSLFIGFESINGRALHSVRKHQNRTQDFVRTISEIHRRGIMVNASMAFGFDQDHPDVFERSLDWLVRNKVETLTAHILTPYPGTRLHKRLLAENRITDFDASHYDTAHAVFTPRHMTPEQLESGYLRFSRAFYSFRNIRRGLPDDPRMRIPYLLFNLGYRKFGKITSLVGRFGLMNRIGRLARSLSYGIE
jgi:radical SAM superfamily enzyme YgiQ (UPF0313 family)